MKIQPILIAFVLAVSGFASQGQTIQYLNSNNIIAGIGIGGGLFEMDSFRVGDLFQTKFDSGRAEIFGAALWMTGVDETGNLHGAVNRYFDFGQGFFDGPISANYDNSYDSYYKRVWKVTKTQINQFKSLIFPTTANLVDSVILYWPGKGNPSALNDYAVSIDSPLAPFIDLNGNGIYEPLEGDYPAFLGDQAVFFVYNDINGTHPAFDCIPLGVEIRGLATCFTDTLPDNLPYNKRAINNSIFVQYEIENKSQHTYSTFDLGQWLDPDIGCFQDDYTGCDSSRSLMFAYNATTDDVDCAPELGFRTLPVALGVQFLSYPMNVYGYFSGANTPQFDSIPLGSDSLCSTFRNYMQGFWNDSVPFTYGGTGYNPNGRPTKFLLSGDPNEPSQWSEVSMHFQASDIRMFGAVDSLTFAPGQTLTLALSFFTSFDSTSNHLSIVDTLKNDADTIRQFYLHHILPFQQTLGINPIPTNTPFTVSLYPNPSNNLITIEAGEEIQSIQLMDIEGRILLTKTVGATKVLLPVANLARGVYLLNVIGQHNSVIKKLVVE